MTARNARPGGHPGTGTGSPREASTSAIEAVGLTKSFGSVRALDGFGLTVSRGSVCALLGPNGAGKTTAIRILATLTRPDAGRASVAGYDVARQPALVRRHIGLLTTQYLDEADRLADGARGGPSGSRVPGCGRDRDRRAGKPASPDPLGRHRVGADGRVQCFQVPVGEGRPHVGDPQHPGEHAGQ